MGELFNKQNAFYFDEHSKVDVECIKIISREFALKNLVFPFKREGDLLYIAMLNINNKELIERIRLITKMEVVPCKALEKQLVLTLKSYYEKAEVENTVNSLKEIFRTDKDVLSKKEREFEVIKNSPTVRLTDYIVTEAIMKGASDIHIEPRELKIVIRYRIDGILRDVFNLPMDIYSAIITRIKVMSDMDISEKRMPQDGKAKYRAGEVNFDLRISSLPTVYGEKIVIRILYKSLQWSNLKNLEFNDSEYKLMKRSLMHTHGMIVITGPTGSGKSSTLYAMLGEVNERHRNITTVEDPVEFGITGINQVNVNKKAGITFASGLRSILRQDPDIIMIGEIRDEETAAIAVRAAITGHLVLTTLHTNDSISAINRLSEMNVPRYLLADAIISIVSQRLIRKICSFCKSEYEASEAHKKILGEGVTVLFRGQGCLKCSNTGYMGRKAVCEILYLDDNMRKLFLSGEKDETLKEYLNKKKMRFLMETCKEYVVSGETTFEELIRVSNGEINLE